MLTPIEKSVLKAIIEKCGDKQSCLISPEEILLKLPKRHFDNKNRLTEIFRGLEYDGYFDVILSSRKGETVYCITLKERGRGYGREVLQGKRNLVFRAVIAVLSAIITFIVGRVLILLLG